MIEQWFPTLIMYEYLNGYEVINKMLAKKALAFKEKYPDAKSAWVCETYHTSHVVDLRQDEDFIPVISTITNKVYELSIAYGIYKPIKCTGAWVNVAMKGDYQEIHTHPKNHYSAVYYISTPENCGNILFRKEDSMFPLDVTSVPASITHCEYAAEATKLLVFPSSLNHMVRANKSDEPRISLALNFILGDE